MKRYYLSKIFKDLTDPGFPEGVWRHQLQTYYGIDYVGGEIKGDPKTGEPTEKALLVLVGGADQARLQGDPDLVPMLDVPLDTKIAAIQTQTKLEASSNIESIGFPEQDVTDIWSNSDAMRDVLNTYGKLNNPNFDCNKFDVDES